MKRLLMVTVIFLIGCAHHGREFPGVTLYSSDLEPYTIAFLRYPRPLTEVCFADIGKSTFTKVFSWHTDQPCFEPHLSPSGYLHASFCSDSQDPSERNVVVLRRPGGKWAVELPSNVRDAYSMALDEDCIALAASDERRVESHLFLIGPCGELQEASHEFGENVSFWPLYILNKEPDIEVGVLVAGLHVRSGLYHYNIRADKFTHMPFPESGLDIMGRYIHFVEEMGRRRIYAIAQGRSDDYLSLLSDYRDYRGETLRLLDFDYSTRYLGLSPDGKYLLLETRKRYGRNQVWAYDICQERRENLVEYRVDDDNVMYCMGWVQSVDQNRAD